MDFVYLVKLQIPYNQLLCVQLEINMKYFKIIFISLIFISPSVFAAGDIGQLLELSFASKVASTVRPGTAQFSIEDGFNQADCNQSYAAISNEDTHLISMLIAAKAQNKAVEVHLDSNNKYYQDRCLVNYLEIN